MRSDRYGNSDNVPVPKPIPRYGGAVASIDRRRLAFVVTCALAVAGVVVAFAARGDGGPAAPATSRIVTSPPLRGLPVMAVPPVDGGPSSMGADAVAALEDLARRKPRRADVQLALGAARLAASDPRGARTAFEAATALGDPGGAVGQILSIYDAADPDASLARLQALGNSPLAQFEHAVVELWAGRVAVASDELRALRDAQPESFYGVKADDLLHPTYETGYPFFVPSAEPPANADLASLEAAARAAPKDANAQLQYGAALETAGRRRDAETTFHHAVEADPSSIEAQVAAAVGSFSKDQPAAAVGQLGPLVRDHPDDPSPRFHLALLLLWIGMKDRALAEFAQVARDSPDSRLGRLAAEFK
jgi:tetratricopeptide (TPR) repeat protein